MDIKINIGHRFSGMLVDEISTKSMFSMSLKIMSVELMPGSGTPRSAESGR